LPSLNFRLSISISQFAWRLSTWFGRHSGQLKALPPRFDATLEWYGDFNKWKGSGTRRSQANRADTSMPAIRCRPPIAAKPLTRPQSSRLREADFFRCHYYPYPSRGVCPVKAGPAAQSVLMSDPRLCSPSQPQAPSQPALPGGARLRARSVALPTTLTSPATPTLGTHPIISSPSPSSGASSVQPRPRPTLLALQVPSCPTDCRGGPITLPKTMGLHASGGTTVVDVIFALITGTSHESEPRAPTHVVDKAGSLHSAKGGSIPC
jgi:hypothetical protein